MTARSKQAAQTVIRTVSALFARNRQDLTRVLVSYRTFSQRWALYGAFGVKLFSVAVKGDCNAPVRGRVARIAVNTFNHLSYSENALELQIGATHIGTGNFTR